jgi:GTPase
VQECHPPPPVDGRRLRVNTRPPSFALFASNPGELPDSYRRHLVNALRVRNFNQPGTPIRMMLRKSNNPFTGADEARRRRPLFEEARRRDALNQHDYYTYPK